MTPDRPASAVLVKLVKVFVSPDELFEEVANEPHSFANWLVPTLFVAFGGFVLTHSASTEEGLRATARQGMASFATALVALAGVFLAALILWLMGRVFLNTRFPFSKAVEVVGLAGMILALGSVVTALLVWVSGDSTARPALSLFMDRTGNSPRIQGALDVVNLFYLWTTTLLALGFSRLTGVSFKESAFWVFGYWILARIALILLS